MIHKFSSTLARARHCHFSSNFPLNTRTRAHQCVSRRFFLLHHLLMTFTRNKRRAQNNFSPEMSVRRTLTSDEIFLFKFLTCSKRREERAQKHVNLEDNVRLPQPLLRCCVKSKINIETFLSYNELSRARELWSPFDTHSKQHRGSKETTTNSRRLAWVALVRTQAAVAMEKSRSPKSVVSLVEI